MRLIDEQYLKTPVWRSRSMKRYLERLAYKVNRKHTQRLMRLMGLEAIYPKPRTSLRRPPHKTYPYLLRVLATDRPNQLWPADTTYIPMTPGHMHLVTVMDWRTRKAPSWRPSNILESNFCVEALQEAIGRHGCPEILNTDQGVQFTSDAFTGVLKHRGIAIDMDARGRVQHNIFIERLRWTLNHNYVYLHSFANGSELTPGLLESFRFYNHERFHQGTDDRTPDEVSFALPHPLAQVA